MAKGKWAQGITPRNFAWVIKGRLAVAERPGGYGPNHRRVRRQEEIIWLREQGFARVVSLSPTPYNLHAYDELGVPWLHAPLSDTDEVGVRLRRLFLTLRSLSGAGERTLVHRDELGDLVAGAMAGYLVWSEMITEPQRAVSILEQILAGQMGPAGRRLVTVASDLAPSSQDPGDAPPEETEASDSLDAGAG